MYYYILYFKTKRLHFLPDKTIFVLQYYREHTRPCLYSPYIHVLKAEEKNITRIPIVAEMKIYYVFYDERIDRVLYIASSIVVPTAPYFGNNYLTKHIIFE